MMSWIIQLIVQALLSYLGTFAFAICINIPRRAFHACSLCGMAGWLAYWILYQIGLGRMISNLVGALFLALLGSYFAHYKKMPAILFHVPGIVPLVPGATAYEAVHAMVQGDLNLAIRYTFSASLVAGSIALGFMVASLIAEVWLRQWRRHHLQNKLD